MGSSAAGMRRRRRSTVISRTSRLANLTSPRRRWSRRGAGGQRRSERSLQMRIGVSVVEPTGPPALTQLRDKLQRAADDGFSSAWMSQIFGLDTLTAFAVAGSQVEGIELGTAVIPVYPRHPAVTDLAALEFGRGDDAVRT